MPGIARARRLIGTPPLAELVRLLNPPGEETRIVGGALRNAVLGLPVADIDLATTMLPEDASARAGAGGWHAVPTGIEHGTVTIHRDGHAFEVTTLREDIATDGRRAEVRFGRDFHADAARRDFTMNALSMGPDGLLHDDFDGLADLAAQRLRFIGDPDQRMREDFLRGLRFLRFSASYGAGRLDPAGLAAVLRNRDGFARLSRERVRQEMMKLVAARHAAAVIDAAQSHGLVSVFLGVPAEARLFTHALGLADRHGVMLAPVTRLFALVGARAADPASDWQARLKLSNAEIRVLHRLAGAIAEKTGDPRLLAYRLGGPESAVREDEGRKIGGNDNTGSQHMDDAFAALLLRVAVGIDPEAGLGERLAEAGRAVPQFLISGSDLIAAGFKPGPEIGAMLAAIEAAWIAAGFPEDASTQHALMLAQIADARRG